MTKSYHTVNGRIIGETTNGVYTGYLPDAQGNVTATVDENGAIINTYRYKPNGDVLAKTGVGQDPKFLWNGTHGYRQTGVPIADTYIRARHYARQAGQWTSVDRLWPHEQAYSYVLGNPLTYIDPTGMGCGNGWIIIPPSYPYLCKPPGDVYRTSHKCVDDPCGYVKRTGQVDPGELAYVACCMGKAYVCVEGAGEDPGVVHCAKKHEECHAGNGDCDSISNSGCRGKVIKDRDLGGGWFDTGNDIEECKCYAVEADCLDNELVYRKCYPRRADDPNYGKRCGPLLQGLLSTCNNGRPFCEDGKAKDRSKLEKFCKKYGF